MNKARCALRLGVSGLALAGASLISSAAAAQTSPAAQANPSAQQEAAAQDNPNAAPASGGTGATPQNPVATPAIGADNAVPEQGNEVVVTGSSIRGAPPVGSNLISVGQAQIQATPAQSVAQILKTVPQITGATATGQGAYQSFDSSGSYSPTIHSLGGAASNTTLVLIDGHRIALTGLTGSLADPSLVPPSAIERVEVLADGASSVYGSDAVAGVINFITRKSYKGFEANGQLGFGDHYRTYAANLLFGTTWETGSAFVAYSYSKRSDVLSQYRSFTRRDHRAQGGTNQAGFACSPANITLSSLVYAPPYAAGTGVANTAANAFCDFSGLADLVPEELRNNGMIKVRQEVGDKLELEADAVYARRINTTRGARGSVVATIFGPGSGRGTQINPFYQGVQGSTATQETINFDFNNLLGPGAKSIATSEDFYVHSNAAYKIDDNWRVEADGVFGFDNSDIVNTGFICSSCVNLALNGTTNSAGSLTTPSVPATGQIVLQPLTTANALDVFNLGSSNRTSAATLANIVDSENNITGRQTLLDGRLQVSGNLFSLPGGGVKIAVGGEILKYTARALHVSALGTGPASTGSQRRSFIYPSRTVKSAFAEFFVPIVSPEMGVPAVRSLSVNLSGRIDHYSDVGTTRNPKIAANWEMFKGLKLRGNYARSFVAPQLQHIGIPPFGQAGLTAYMTAPGDDRVALPISLYPQAALLPGCGAPATTCLIADAAGIRPGIEVRKGVLLDPEKGNTFSVGGDFTPEFARGLRISVTYWQNRFRGGVTAPAGLLAGNSADLANRFTFYPNGATQAEIAAATQGIPQTGAIPLVTYFIYDRSYGNVINLDVAGIDIDTSYTRNTGIGRFTVGNAFTYLTRFDQFTGRLGKKFSLLNSSGFNLTFPSIRFTGRANVGYEYKGLSFDAFLNYIGSYKNYSSLTVAPLTRDSSGNPTGGGDTVKANQTVDLHLSYTIPNFLNKAQIFVDANNVLNTKPSFFNSAIGYDGFTGNPILRIVTVGLRTSF